MQSERSGELRRHFNYSNVMSTLSVFLVIAGGTAVAASLPKNSVGPKQIKRNAVKGPEIAKNAVKGGELRDSSVGTTEVIDDSLGGTDIDESTLQGVSSSPTGPAGGDLTGNYPFPTVANNAVGADQVEVNSLTSDDLGPSSVATSEVAGNSLTRDDLGSSSVASSEVAADSLTEFDLGDSSVGSSEVDNGTLNDFDVGVFSGSAAGNFDSVAANDCEVEDIDATPGAENIQADQVMVSPGTGFVGNVSFHVENEVGGLISMKACNPTSSAIDPDGAGTSYHYIVFDN